MFRFVSIVASRGFKGQYLCYPALWSEARISYDYILAISANSSPRSRGFEELVNHKHNFSVGVLC